MKRTVFLIVLLSLVLTACRGGQTSVPQGAASPSAAAPAQSEAAAPSQAATPAPAETATAAPPPAPTAAPLPPYESPAWFRESTLYLIFVRSFADSDGDGIGDLNGVAANLDYLQSLGVDTLWLMPIYPSPSQHGYDVSDFTAVNPQYGTLEDLQALVRAVHDRGMHLLLDFVPSHLSSDHPYFQDAYANPQSPYSDWFVWTNDAHTRYAGFAGSESMPRFNHYNPEVVQFLSDAALFWLDLDGDGDYTDGVDGFRVDNATFPPPEFFRSLRSAVKAANPQALLLGETWVENPGDLSHFFTDQFDALFDFPLYALLQGNPSLDADGLLAGKSTPVLLNVLLQDEAKYYPPQGIPVRFVSNHDTNRVATEVGGDPARERLAIALTAALPGVPMVYYGEEIGMFGRKGGPPYWDNYRREPMDWYAAEDGPQHASWFMPPDRWNKPDDGISVEEQDADPDSLLNFYRRALKARQSLPALRSGTMQILSLDMDAPGAWGLTRSDGDQTVVALFNFSDAPRQVTLPEFPFEAPVLVDLLSGTQFPAAQIGQAYTLTLPPGGAVWLSAP